MNATLEIIKTYGPGVFVALVVIALAINGLKELISVAMGWLSKKVGRRLEDDAERYRHQLSRDMEAYKNELSRSLNVERIKSEVRRAVAEKLLNRRLEALQEVHHELYRVPTWVTSIVQLPYEQERYTEVAERMEKFGGTLEANALYFTNHFNRDYHLLAGQLFGLVTAWRTGPVLDGNDPRIGAVYQSTASLQRDIEIKHRLLPDEISGLMVENPPLAIPAAAADGQDAGA